MLNLLDTARGGPSPKSTIFQKRSSDSSNASKGGGGGGGSLASTSGASSRLSMLQKRISGGDKNSTQGNNKIELKLDKMEVFGREMEQMELSRIIPNVIRGQQNNKGGPQVIVVHGKQGCGKTSLVHSMQQTWTSSSSSSTEEATTCMKNALFVSATFDKNEEQSSAGSRSALVDAFEDLCRAWTATPNGKNEIEEYLLRVKKQEEMIHRSLPKLYNNNNKNKGTTRRSITSSSHTSSVWSCTIDSPDGKTCLYRKKLAFKVLLNSICNTKPSRPVILFLDDFQCADEPSLDILNFLLQQQQQGDNNNNNNKNGDVSTPLQGLVLVVAYRDESPPLPPPPPPPPSPPSTPKEDLGSDSTSEAMMTLTKNEDNNKDSIIPTTPATTTTTTTTNLAIQMIQNWQSRSSTLQQSDTTTTTTTTSNFIHEIQLQDLDQLGTNEMISGILNLSLSTTTLLSEVIYRKTNGNPFCICQFLRLLQEEQLLFYNVMKYQWEWKDVTCIQNSTSIISDNVADLITSSIQKLSYETQKVLMVASCLGKQIPYQVLQQFFSDEEEEQDSNEFTTTSTTTGPGAAGEEDSSSFSLSDQEVNSTNLESILESTVTMEVLTKRSKDSSSTAANCYNWSHERVREGVYGMLSKRERAKWHLRLGKVAYKLRSSNPHEDWLVYLTRDQFSKLTPLVSDKKMRVNLAKLNLEAAQLCISHSAFYPAGKMLREGINLLDPETRWTEHYDICIEMYTNLAEISYSLGNHEASKKAVDAVLRHAKTPQEKSRANFTLVQSIAAGPSRDYVSAVEKTIELLAHEGVRIRPTTSMKPQLGLPQLPGLIMPTSSSPRTNLDELSDLPIMEDEKSKMISKLLTLLAMFAVHAERMSLAETAVQHCTQLAIKSGISSNLPTAVAVQGLILMHQGKINQAQSQGHLALNMLQKFEDQPGEFHVRTVQMVYSGIINAIKPFHESLDVFMGLHEMGLATKDLEHAILGGKHYSLCYLAVGLPLGPLESDLTTFTEESKQSGLGPSVEIYFRIFRQTILNLQGKAANPTILQGEAIDARSFLSEMQGHCLLMARRDVATFQLMLAYIFNDFDMAEKMLNILEPFPFTDVVVARGHIRLMFMGLAGFALGRKRGLNGYRYLGIARKVLKHFEVAVKHGSVNAHPVLEFLQAEESPSREAYEKAIRTSARSGLMHLQAMVNERAGRLFLDQSDEHDASFYLSKAEHLYQDWGATAKVAQLRHDHTFLSSVSNDEQKRGVSVGLKGRKRVSLRNFAAIHEYNKFPSLRNIPNEEEGTASNKVPSRRGRNQSLGLGTFDLSFNNDDSASLHFSMDSNNGLESLEDSSTSFSEPDRESHSRCTSDKRGIFNNFTGLPRLSVSSTSETQSDESDFLSPPRKQKSGIGLAAMAGFTRSMRPSEDKAQGATNGASNQQWGEGGDFQSPPRKQKSGIGLAAMAAFTRSMRPSEDEAQGATNGASNEEWGIDGEDYTCPLNGASNQPWGDGVDFLSPPRKQKSGIGLAAMAAFTRSMRPSEDEAKGATNNASNEKWGNDGRDYTSPRKQKSGIGLAAMAGFTRSMRPSEDEAQSATNATWNRPGRDGGDYTSPRKHKSGIGLSNMARGMRRNVSGVSSDMMQHHPSSSNDRGNARWDDAATTTTTNKNFIGLTMPLKRSNLASSPALLSTSRSRQAFPSSGQLNIPLQNDDFNGGAQNATWDVPGNDDDRKGSSMLTRTSNFRSLKSNRLASIMNMTPGSETIKSAGRAAMTPVSGTIKSAGRIIKMTPGSETIKSAGRAAMTPVSGTIKSAGRAARSAASTLASTGRAATGNSLVDLK